MSEFQDPKAAPAQGGGWLKWVLACGCALVLLGVLGAVLVGIVAARAVSSVLPDLQKIVPATEPAEVASRLQDILPAQVPPGYEGVFSMAIPGGFEFAVVAPAGLRQGQQTGSQPPALLMMVCTIPPGEQAEQLKKKMARALAEKGQQQDSAALEVETPDGKVTQKVTVRGDTVTLEQAVGKTKDGHSVKQVMALVPRKKGSQELVMIMGLGDADNFDQAALDAFLGSVR